MRANEDSFLESLRRDELDTVRKWFSPGAKILEIGGNSGFQAAILTAWGYQVTSVDIRIPPGKRYFHVSEYDGLHIPAADAAFDIVYSSHVLYYMLNKPEFFGEVRRVLKPDGLAIHIMPTCAWRVATSATYYVYLVKRIPFHLLKLLGLISTPAVAAVPSSIPTSGGRAEKRKWWTWLACRPLDPHSAIGVEFWSWRRKNLKRLFSQCGFETVVIAPLRLFYTQFAILGKSLSLSGRRFLSIVFGSASAVYVTRQTSLGIEQ